MSYTKPLIHAFKDMTIFEQFLYARLSLTPVFHCTLSQSMFTVAIIELNSTFLNKPLSHFIPACVAWFHIDIDNFSLRLTMQPLDRTPKKVRAKIEDPIPMVQHALFLPLTVSLICSGMYSTVCKRMHVSSCVFWRTDFADKYLCATYHIIPKVMIVVTFLP